MPFRGNCTIAGNCYNKTQEINLFNKIYSCYFLKPYIALILVSVYNMLYIFHLLDSIFGQIIKRHITHIFLLIMFNLPSDANDPQEQYNRATNIFFFNFFDGSCLTNILIKPIWFSTA